MDIYRFFNSKDVADYLREIGYEFTAPEAAFIIYRSSDATLDEKIAAWQEIAETMPDCSMEKRPWLKEIQSTRDFLLDYISLTKRELEAFGEQNGSIFRYQYNEYDLGWQDDGNYFSSVEACLDYMREYWADGGDGSILGFRVAKAKIDHPTRTRNDWLCFDRDMKVTDVDIVEEDGLDLDLKLQFEGMWFAIPTPFKRGDIVRDARCRGNGLFVLDWLPSWGKSEYIANGFREGERAVERADWCLAHWSKNGDTTDMICGGWWLDDGGDLYRDHTGGIYLDLEYASATSCEDRWAEVVSAYLKCEIAFDEAQGLLRFLQIDNEARTLRKHYDGYYDVKYYPDGVWQRIKREGKWMRD